MPEPGFDAIADALEADWHAKARPEQLPPSGDWFVWLILSGRGWGKTRTGAEWILDQVRRGVRHLALIGATTGDVRSVMLSGPSGLLTVAQGADRPDFEPSNRCLTWPNGAVAYLYSAEEPNRLRGPQFEAVWCDELAAWFDPDEVWEQLGYGLRIGSPKVVITTTPRPIPLIKKLVKTSNVIVTRGSTFANQSNLSKIYFDNVIAPKVGTRSGRQEIEGEILEDTPGALWSLDLIERARVSAAPALIRTIVGVDPAVTSGESSDLTGIVAVGIAADGHAYLLKDVSGRYSPLEWAAKAVGLYWSLKADRICAETNQGGDMIEGNLRNVDPNVSYKGIPARQGKITRAEPVAACYEQGRVHHVGVFPELETELCNYVPGARKSPDRLDALVHAVAELLIHANAPTTGMIGYYRELAEAQQAGEIAGPAFGWAISGPGAPGLTIRLVAPPGMTTIILQSGRSLTPDADGVVTVPTDDAGSLRALGWAEAPATLEIEGSFA